MGLVDEGEEALGVVVEKDGGRLAAGETFVDVGTVVSSFRWHPDSLTVSDRTTSLDESEAVKRRYLSARARRLSWLWEQPVRVATRAAAREVTRRARQRSRTENTSG